MMSANKFMYFRLDICLLNKESLNWFTTGSTGKPSNVVKKYSETV